MAIFSNMISVFFLAFFVSIASSNHVAGPGGPLTNAVNQFSTELFEAVTQGGGGGGGGGGNNNNNNNNNILVGGMSAHIALALLSLGATGNTLNELNQGLHLQDDSTKASYQQAIQKMNSYKQVQFQWADKLYIQNGNGLNPGFQASASQIFNIEVENIDFTNGGQAAAQINSWVEKNTHNTVNDLVKGGDFNGNTVSVLVNTLYFQGGWDKPFNPSNTAQQDFHVKGGGTVKVNMMNQQCDTKYGEDAGLDAKILEMAFNGNEMSVVFILPNQADGLANLENKLKNTNVAGLVKNLTQQTVNVNLPKFGVGNANVFDDAICKLGMCAMFNPANAELKGILANPNIPLQVTHVYHKTYFNVHEGGVTTGAAAAAAVAKTNQPSKRSNPQQFTADHPYFFAGINEDGQIVFSGHFTGQNN